MPVIEVYAGLEGTDKPEKVITGDLYGYATREDLLQAIVRCWDMAEKA